MEKVGNHMCDVSNTLKYTKHFYNSTIEKTPKLKADKVCDFLQEFLAGISCRRYTNGRKSPENVYKTQWAKGEHWTFCIHQVQRLEKLNHF